MRFHCRVYCFTPLTIRREMQILLVFYIVMSIAEILSVGGFLTGRNVLIVSSLSRPDIAYRVLMRSLVDIGNPHRCDSSHSLGTHDQRNSRLPTH